MRLPPVRHEPRDSEGAREEVQGKAKGEGTCKAGCCRFNTVNPDYYTSLMMGGVAYTASPKDQEDMHVQILTGGLENGRQ